MKRIGMMYSNRDHKRKSGESGHHLTLHILLQTVAAGVVISRFQVLEHCEAAGAEAVHYDQALVFTRSDGYPFSLAVQDSAVGGLEFSAHLPILSSKTSSESTLSASVSSADGTSTCVQPP